MLRMGATTVTTQRRDDLEGRVPPSTVELHNVVVEFLNRTRLTQQELANLSGVNLRTINAVCNPKDDQGFAAETHDRLRRTIYDYQQDHDTDTTYDPLAGAIRDLDDDDRQVVWELVERLRRR